MRSISGTRNRVVLTVFGILALVAAAWLCFAHLGVAARWPQAELILAHGSSTPGSIATGHRVWLLPVSAVLAVLAVVIGIALLATQVPAQTPTSTLRLTDAEGNQLATLDPDVLGRALGEHAQQIPGVLDADVRVSGATSALWLQASVGVSEDAEVPWTLDRVRQRLADDVERALGRAPRQVDVLVHLRTKGSAGNRGVVPSAGAGRDRGIETSTPTAPQGSAA